MALLNYQIHSDSNNKPWMMLIHGLFGNLDNLAGLRRQFSDDYQILSVDLPDHGKSPYSQHFSFEEYSKQCVELLASLEINQR